ncbi:MAG: hypothetical protein SVY15_08795 [Halobacteriota archaeon]|nr:hypothetical protein [Halobacteriota archaeon]
MMNTVCGCSGGIDSTVAATIASFSLEYELHLFSCFLRAKSGEEREGGS